MGCGSSKIFKKRSKDLKKEVAPEIRCRKAVVRREDGTVVPDEVFSFPSTCSSCGHELETLMQQVNIPYFQVSILDQETAGDTLERGLQTHCS